MEFIHQLVGLFITQKRTEETPLPRTLPPLPPPLSEPPDNPATLVLSGQRLFISYDGTSESVQGGGVSACGLAALNCARIVLGKSKLAMPEGDLLEDMISEDTVREIVSICPMWTGSTDLGIEEIIDLPIFNNFIKPLGVNWGKATRSGFTKMLKRLEDVQQHPVVVTVITKIPEIIVCIRLVIQEQNVFVILDPNSRPSHPDGSGLIIDANEERILDYLMDLMGVDEDVLNDPTISWEVAKLSTFCGHCFIPSTEEPDLESLVLQLSVKPYSQRDSDERSRTVKEERDRFLTRLIQWRAYAETQTAALNAYKEEAVRVQRQALRDRDLYREEIEELRRQIGQETNAQRQSEGESSRAWRDRVPLFAGIRIRRPK
ncbi:hypothetical protein BDN72DRAFT_845586 [Pluteus cervinus]|uniref:Uncharacterized protein n=1 Tax=Pluteus cervinus TaxID=181527 RepID=A0ACD3AIG6_9AGAR|nr:hypothetical protein BDN72DRAFT_845586 [Pluteus cervinus]